MPAGTREQVTYELDNKQASKIAVDSTLGDNAIQEIDGDRNIVENGRTELP